ncbi:MAG TPA: peptidylprolyl isomerase [Bryobacteraceae bacterium]|nr:peptidylprolyl isomerase [Bryobacteraceae bacterium]
MRLRIASPILGLLMLAACSSTPEPKKEAAPPPEPEAPKASTTPSKVGVPEVFKVKMETSKGPVVIEVHREWAPIGADRFYELVKDGFFQEARFFRIVPNFIVQFGLAADPKMSKKWDKTIADDPVSRTNRAGAVTFATAGPNTRNSQIFINLGSNQSLDNQGFAPFGQVIEGMDVVQRFNASYGEMPDQQAITMRGNAYLKEKFPNLDYIKTAVIQ